MAASNDFSSLDEDSNAPCVQVGESPCNLCSQLQEMDREYVESKQAFKRVSERRRLLRTEINQQHDFFNRIPLEVTSQIFRFCLPPVPTVADFLNIYAWSNEGSMHQPNFRQQFRLGWICQSWRQLLYSNPHFWNVIYLPLYTSSPLFLNNILQEWISRSAELPLSLHIRLTRDEYEQVVESRNLRCHTVLEAIVMTLSTCIHRWSLAHLGLPSSYLCNLKSSLPSMHAIKGLSISATPEATEMGAVENRSRRSFNLGSIPQPTTLSIGGFQLRNVKIDYRNLTVFQGYRLLDSECLEILRSAPHLTDCAFEAVLTDAGGVFPGSYIQLDSLRKLRVSSASGRVFQHHVCPALQELDFYTFGSFDLNWITDFIERSRCSLKYIRASSVSALVDRALENLLSVTPTLQTLILNTAPSDSLFERLAGSAYHTPGQENESFLPHLQRLEVYGSRTFRWSSIPLMFPLFDPQETRLRRPLEKLEIAVDEGFIMAGDMASTVEAFGVDTIDKQSLEDILDCIADGVEIEILGRPTYQNIIEDSLESHEIGDE